MRRHNLLFGHIARLAEDYQFIKLCSATLTCHSVVLLIAAGDVVQYISEGGGLTSFTGTTKHHLLICGDEPSHMDTHR